MEETGEGCGFFCSPKLPYLSTILSPIVATEGVQRDKPLRIEARRRNIKWEDSKVKLANTLSQTLITL